jgi:hypothetical protein
MAYRWAGKDGREQMNNKRVAPRKDTFFYLTVTDASTEAVYGRVVDISERGLLLVTDQPGAIPPLVTVRVQIPTGPGGGSSFSCVLTRRWQRRDRNPQLTLVGCEMKTAPENEAAINNLILRYSFGGETELQHQFS